MHLSNNLLEETRALWNQGKKVMVQVANNLIKIREGEEWKSYGHDTFQKFCDVELDIKQSQASKLLIVGEYFLKEYTPEQIGSIDAERLYAASRLPGTVEQNLAKARTWSRSDFKENAAQLDPHEIERVTYCKKCGLSEARHP